MRTCYLLCYDVRDERRLRRTARVAEEFGQRLEYSIFLCPLDAVERTRLEGRLRRVLDLHEDRVLLVDLGPAGAPATQRLHWICGAVKLPEPGEATVV